jgi:hypothetical protein
MFPRNVMRMFLVDVESVLTRARHFTRVPGDLAAYKIATHVVVPLPDPVPFSPCSEQRRKN